jgi:hypothetical protein
MDAGQSVTAQAVTNKSNGWRVNLDAAETIGKLQE